LQVALVPDPWDPAEMSHQEFLELTLYLASREGFNNARHQGAGALMAQVVRSMSKNELDTLDSLVRKVNKLFQAYLEDHRP
jgi:hypothetical protein